MFEFRRNAEAILRRTQQGQRMILTYRGKPVARLEPIDDDMPQDSKESNFVRSLCELGEKWVGPGPTTPLTNEEIDRIVYGL